MVLAAGVFSICSTLALFVLLPYDSAVLSFFRFSTQRTISFLGQPFRDEEWVFHRPDFPVDLEADVALVLKTGYGTQERIGMQLDALGPGHDDSLILIADFSGEYNHSGRTIPIRDMVAATTGSPFRGAVAGLERVEKHSRLAAAIKAGKGSEAVQLAKTMGWELDVLKVGGAAPLPSTGGLTPGSSFPGSSSHTNSFRTGSGT